MRSAYMTSAALLACAALSLVACERQKRADIIVGGKALSVPAQLVCPASEDDFKKTGVAPDGQSCTYLGPNGGELTLARLNTGADVDGALSGLEQDLRKLLPPHQDDGAKGVKIEKKWESGEDGSASHDHDHHTNDNADIDLPGLHIHAHGDKAEVIAPGVHVNANDDGAQVSTSLGGLKDAVINANSNGAEIRSDETDRSNIDRTWVLASSEPGPDGWRRVAYVARGPKGGPIIVARLRSKEDHHDGFQGGFGTDALRRLVNDNFK